MFAVAEKVLPYVGRQVVTRHAVLDGAHPSAGRARAGDHLDRASGVAVAWIRIRDAQAQQPTLQLRDGLPIVVRCALAQRSDRRKQSIGRGFQVLGRVFGDDAVDGLLLAGSLGGSAEAFVEGRQCELADLPEQIAGCGKGWSSRWCRTTSAALLLLLAGCSAASEPGTASSEPGPPAILLGAADSACSLPVTFGLLPLWKPEAVDLAGLGELADLYRNGPFEAVCEVDAKPAGEIGFLRVYTAPGRTGSSREHLEAFIAGESPEARRAGNLEVTKTDYRDLTLDGRPATEVTYETHNKSLGHWSKYSAFALTTGESAVVVKLSPFGDDEYGDLLPAYELARSTVREG